MGHQGSGKGTQAELLASKEGFLRVEAGRLLRVAAKTNKEIDEIVNKKGQLVPDRVVFNLVIEFIEKNKEKHKNIVFDGFPRTIEQFNLLADWMRGKDMKLDRVYFLDISTDETVKRLSSRRICDKCGEVYNLITNPPSAENSCKCGGKLVQRKDDAPLAIKKRLEWSHRELKVLVDKYKEIDLYEKIEGERSIMVIYEDLLSRIKSYEN